MNVFLARLTQTTEPEKYGPKPFVGIFFADDVHDLFRMVDEQVPPFDCEYALIQSPFGIHVDMVPDEEAPERFMSDEIYFGEDLMDLMGQAMTAHGLSWVSMDTLQQPISSPGRA